MHPALAFLYRAFLPAQALVTDLVNALDEPPGPADFPSKMGHHESRGRMCVLAEISRRLGSNNGLRFRDLFTVSPGKPHMIRPCQITCTTNPELQLQTWESFCQQEGEATDRGYGCRSHADYRRLEDQLINGFFRSERSVARFGSEIIWQSDGNHRIAAMAHFSRTQPDDAYAIDVTMQEYIPNHDHPLAQKSFGLIRERKKAAPDLYTIMRQHPELEGRIKIHPLREGRLYGETADTRFEDTSLVIFTAHTPLADLVQRTLRENHLFWDLRQYFRMP